MGPLFYIKEDTTVGELKKFLSQIEDDAKIITQIVNGPKINLRLDHFPGDSQGETLYIEEL